MNTGFADAEEAVVLTLVSFVGVVFLISGLWLRQKLGADKKWNALLKQLPTGGKPSPRKWALLGVPLFILSLLSLKSHGGFNYLLFPALIAFLTLPLASGMTIPLIIAACLGLSLLLALGDSAIALVGAEATIRWLVWSVLFFLFITAPFLCFYRAFRKELKPNSPVQNEGDR